MMFKPSAFATSVTACAATLGLAAGLAFASHVTITAPSGSPTVIVPPAVEAPSGSTTVIVPPAIGAPPAAPVPQTLQVEDIRAHQVRAHTIYANQIEADQIQGALHQTGTVKIRDVRGDIKAPQVMATVIYADSIKANSVVAEQIYVRDLKLHR